MTKRHRGLFLILQSRDGLGGILDGRGFGKAQGCQDRFGGLSVLSMLSSVERTDSRYSSSLRRSAVEAWRRSALASSNTRSSTLR